MLIVTPDCEASSPDGLLGDRPGGPWAIRLAGGGSACLALELYEAGDLLDVISATKVARKLLRGARSTLTAAGPRAIAWGRMPAAGAQPQVWFSPRGRHAALQAAVLCRPAAWCWIAVGDGRLSVVTVRAGDQTWHRRLARGVPCC